MIVQLSTFSNAWGEAPVAAPTSALVDYVRKPDASYAWKLRREGDLGTGRYAELILTSQRWHDITWRHQLFIYKPAKLRHLDRGLLLVGGGRWRDELLNPPTADEKLPNEAGLLAGMADKLETVVAVVLQVPNQPILGDLYEDAAISYSFEQFIKTGESDWPLLLPMVKSAVRAMDAVGAFSQEHWQVKPVKFTLTGASKRGWTTWLTSAVDERVTALAPMVIDMLNMPEHIRLQMTSWGKFSEQIHDYTQRGLHLALMTPAGGRLLDAVDPFRYRERLVQPKLVLLGTNDRYWPLDSANLYFNDLPADKYLLYVPNNGHGLRDMLRVVGGIAALHRHGAGDLTLPKLTWDYRDMADGGEANPGVELTIRSDQKPASVQVWSSKSATRDFREAVWTAQPVKEEDGRYVYRLPMPEAGMAALIGEALYDDAVMPYYLSTAVRIIGGASKPVGGQ